MIGLTGRSKSCGLVKLKLTCIRGYSWAAAAAELRERNAMR